MTGVTSTALASVEAFQSGRERSGPSIILKFLFSQLSFIHEFQLEALDYVIISQAQLFTGKAIIQTE